MIRHRIGVLDVLAFIQYHIFKGIIFKQFNIPPQKAVGRQHNRIAVELLPRLPAPLLTGILIHPQRAKALYLPLPVRKQGGRHHNQRSLYFFRHSRTDYKIRLHRISLIPKKGKLPEFISYGNRGKRCFLHLAHFRGRRIIQMLQQSDRL